MELFDTNFVYFGQVLLISGMTQLARGCGANDSGAWRIVVFARVRRVAGCIARAVSIFTR